MTKTLERIISPIATFVRMEAAGGILLMTAAAVALVWANSPFGAVYAAIWQTPLTMAAGGLELSKPLLLWINDGLMALFFLLIGLEIKRELVWGALASLRKAALPMAAAVGGMVVPALLYVLTTGSPAALPGWGIPVATDIAFALGILLLLGTRAPLELKIFLTAVAIVDDVGAVLIISLFYTASLEFMALAAAAGIFALALAGNRMGVRSLAFYAVLGVLLWGAILQSGVHATVAGVLLATVVPMGRGAPSGPEGEDSPLHRLEHGLHPWVVFAILPVFALANAGVAVGSLSAGPVGSEVIVGIVAGLVVGKPLGILSASWLAIRFRLAELPKGITWRQMGGVAALSGIGFTMSLFIGGLAFSDPALLAAAKVGVLVASGASALLGLALLLTPAADLPERRGDGSWGARRVHARDYAMDREVHRGES